MSGRQHVLDEHTEVCHPSKSFRELMDKDGSSDDPSDATKKIVAKAFMCGAGIAAVWSDNKTMKACVSGLFLWKLWRMYQDNDCVKDFVKNMIE